MQMAILFPNSLAISQRDQMLDNHCVFLVGTHVSIAFVREQK